MYKSTVPWFGRRPTAIRFLVHTPPLPAHGHAMSRALQNPGRKALALLLAAVASAAAVAQDPQAAPRRAMVEEIRAIARDAGRDTGRPTIADRVLAAMDKVPRHRFVPPAEVPAAYANRPLPIGHGQTISQPYIVALMTDLIDPQPTAVVLEIGTGSGYQAAILAELVRTVCTIEIIEPLARQAEERLRSEGYSQVRTRIGDGYFGWEECGPFDAILVTAAASQIPPPLVRQLKPGGRMVIPVGAPFLAQYLTIVDKAVDGSVTTRQILPVRFVPLTGRR
jgi:protein-L-isoaspartate(D-aspartate) O-methyltransferase